MKICVIGLGYIGLPTALLLSKKFDVTGYDINPVLVENINNKIVPFSEPGMSDLLENSTITADTHPTKSDVFIICVPTPFDKEVKMADLRFVKHALKNITPYLEKNNLVIIESTITPGTCKHMAKQILEKSGFTVGTDIFLAHCPERAIPGKTFHEMVYNDRIIGGIDKTSRDMTEIIYQSFVKGQIFKTDATTAEFVKLMENTSRDVNIALANEFAILADEIGINIWEAIKLANKHPRVNILNPGPGVGGHCIAVDPWFLTESSVSAALITTAREINDNMPSYVFLTLKRLFESKKILKPTITLFGVAYKGNIGDTRETPALKIIKLCEREGWEVRIYDPHVKKFEYPVMQLSEATIDSDCIVLLTDHAEYQKVDPITLKLNNKIFFDTRNVLDHKRWRDAGFFVIILGNGSER
ncbi:MAG: nucleotide sugar dehydrogenase [Methanoregula sp.]